MLSIRFDGPKDSIHINGLTLTLKDRIRDAQPYALRAEVLFKAIDYHNPVCIYNDTTKTGLNLEGGMYLLPYHFASGNKKRDGKTLQIDIAANFTQGRMKKEIKESIGFRRFFWLDIAGNGYFVALAHVF